MPGTKNVRTNAKNKKVSSASDFKKASKPFEVELPSGNVALLKRPGMPTLIAKGLFSDALLPIIQDAISQSEGKSKSQSTQSEMMAEILADKKKLSDMFDSFDRVLVETVVQPPVKFHKVETEKDVWVPIPDDDRDEEILYADEVELEDKMFIFQYVVGGTSDIESFREQQSQNMAAVSDEQGV